MDDIYFIKDSLKIKVNNEFSLSWNEIVNNYIQEKYYFNLKSSGKKLWK